MTTLVLTSRNVLLPTHDEPQPATIHADPSTGKITSIELFHSSESQWTNKSKNGDCQFIDAGDLYILPGLVESVKLFIVRYPNSGWR